MKYFVFYNDGYYECGGVGFEVFNDKKKAIEFINERYQNNDFNGSIYRIVEGNKERIQIFEGTVIAIDNKGLKKTFTVRRISYDVGVERVFPVFSPRIAKIDVVRKGKIRRAKLYYLRERRGKASKLKERRIMASSKGKKNKPVEENKAPEVTPEAAQEAVENTEE